MIGPCGDELRLTAFGYAAADAETTDAVHVALKVLENELADETC